MKLGRVVYNVLGGVQAAIEFMGALRRLVRKARKGVLPLVDDTQPIPLRHPVIRPPPLPHEPLKRR
jgi:hypothetical protein